MLMTPELDPLSPAQKPASKTLEGKAAVFSTIIGALVALLGVLLDSGLLDTVADGKAATIAGALLTAAASFGFSAHRSKLKANANESTARAAAHIEAAKIAAAAGAPVNPS